MRTLKMTMVGALAASALVVVFQSRGHSGFLTSTDPIPEVGAEGGPSRTLTSTEAALWKSGRLIFDHDFTPAEGMGNPNLNGDSCRACHIDGGIGGAGGLDVNVFRFGNDNGGAGPFTNVAGGQIASKVQRPDTPVREEYDPALADCFEQRQTPTLFGLGLIESIPAANITANEDPNDTNADGISGFAHRVTVNGVQEIGRFGWKANIPTIRDFIRDAMQNELGVTTIDDGRGFGIATDTDGVADPELSQADSDAMFFFFANLAAPPRAGNTDPGVLVGATLFTQVGCANCHIPTLQGSGGPVPLFSDLLLHNVAAPGFRGMEDGQATVGEYRTPPLWGLRRTAPYMHDGRAATIAAAIAEHFGEATAAKNAYNALLTGQKNALILFLSDL